MEATAAKIVSMFLLGGISLFLGLLPLLLKKCNLIGQSTSSRRGKFAVSALSCFGGGVILATCFTHMLPEVNTFMKKNIQEGHFPDTGLAMSEILMLCGFFMIYIVEEVTHVFVNKLQRSWSTSTKREKMKKVHVNGQIPEIKDGCCNSPGREETQPMYQNSHHSGQAHVHEEAPIDLLESLETENQFQAALRGFLVILALSLHAVFEGIALGLTKTSNGAWFLFFAISCHKYVISFCIGMQFISSGIKPWMVILYVSTFALISPIGVGIGIAISETVPDEASLQGSLVTILQALATGTLLYVVFF